MPRSVLVLTFALVAPLAVACSDNSTGVAVPGDTTTTDAPPATAATVASTTTETAATDAPSPTTEAATTMAPTTTIEPGPPTTAERSVILLRQGDEGPRVEVVQLKLIALGYLPAGSATGVFDGATNDAVLQFQSEYGLVVDGLVGPETERSISAAAQSVNPDG